MKVEISLSAKPNPKKYEWFTVNKKIKFDLAVADAEAEFNKGDRFGLRTLYGKRYILDGDDMSEHFQIEEDEYDRLMKVSSKAGRRTVANRVVKDETIDVGKSPTHNAIVAKLPKGYEAEEVTGNVPFDVDLKDGKGTKVKFLTKFGSEKSYVVGYVDDDNNIFVNVPQELKTGFQKFKGTKPEDVIKHMKKFAADLKKKRKASADELKYQNWRSNQ